MVDIETCRNLALSFPAVVEQDHFGMPSFRYNKKIFMTIHTDKNLVMLKLSEPDQNIFTSANPEIIYPVPGYWGTRGATFFDLTKVTKTIFKNAVKASYVDISKTKKKAKVK
jgi:hypothetical protein